MVEDLVADLLKLVRGEVEEGPALEALRVDPVGYPLELDGSAADLADETAGIRLRLLQRAPFHHHRDVLELAEVAQILGEQGGVALAGREEVSGGRPEGQRPERVDDREGGERQGDEARPAQPPARA